jgi:hypothetical protein
MKIPSFDKDNDNNRIPLDETPETFAHELTEAASTAGLGASYREGAKQIRRVIADLSMIADSYMRIADGWDGYRRIPAQGGRKLLDTSEYPVPEVVAHARMVIERQLFVLSVIEGTHQL